MVLPVEKSELQSVRWEEDTRWSYVLSAEGRRVTDPEGGKAALQRFRETGPRSEKLKYFTSVLASVKCQL